MAGKKWARIWMYSLLLLRSMTVRRGRVVTAISSLAIASAVVTALVAMHLEIGGKMRVELRQYGANLFFGSPNSGTLLEVSELESAIAELPADRLLAASPYLYGMIHVGKSETVLAGVNFSGFAALTPYWQIRGRRIEVSFDERHCMIGRELAHQLKVVPGDTVELTNRVTGFQQSLIVKGVMETGQDIDRMIFVNIGLAQRALGLPGKADLAMASVAASAANIAGWATATHLRHPELVARPVTRFSRADGQVMQRIRGLTIAVIAVIMLSSTLCVTITLAALVAERRHEIGLMKAIGADARQIIGLFMGEAVLIALGGCLVGTLGGYLLAQGLGRALFNTGIGFRPALLQLALLVSFGCAAVGSIAPLRAALQVDPAIILKGDK